MDFLLQKIKLFRWVIIVFWTVILGSVTGFQVISQERLVDEVNLVHARSYFEKDIAYRRWNAQKGGVYAPVNQQTPPNPHLKIPNRDIVTKDGTKLTLINPAYMTRQVHEIENASSGVRGHITSLKPLRPENSADPWETTALLQFEKGVQEVSALSDINGEPYLRFMRPLLAEKPCLKCHEKQGYKEGDIRGGLSVSIPYADISAQKDELFKEIAQSYFLIWLFGLAGIQLSARMLMKSSTINYQTQMSLIESEKRFRGIAEAAHDGIFMLDQSGHLAFCNSVTEEILGYKTNELLSKDFIHLISPQHRYKEIFGLTTENPSIEGDTINLCVQKKNGSKLTVEIAISSTFIEESWYLIGVLRDITEQQAYEEQLKEINQYIKLLLDSTVEAMYSVDMENRCTMVNASCLKMLGYEDESELLGKSIHQIIHHSYPDGTSFKEGESQLIKAISSHEIAHIDDEYFWRKDGSSFPVSFWSHPIIKDGQAMGSVVTFLDISEKVRSTEALSRSNDQILEALEGTIEAISNVLATRDPYTSNHQKRVADLAVTIANEMGMDEHFVKGLYLGAIIHDIGKIQTPSDLLSKPGKLTDIEFELIKYHPTIGHEIIINVAFPWPISNIVYQHHERMDGSGYPLGLKGDDIVIEARIVAVADVVEAIVSHRPYRPGLGVEAALDEIERGSGKLYDSDVVNACLRIFRKKAYQFPE